MSVNFIFFTVFNIFCLNICVKSEAKLRPIYNSGHDVLFVARCEAKCWRSQNKGCLRECLLRPYIKPGLCPQNTTILSPFARVCLELCHADSHCPRLEKCCAHHCGITCQEPDQLSSAVGVPGIPREIIITELRKRAVHIQWTKKSHYNLNNSSTVIFLIEERHHPGKHYTEAKLTKWTPFLTTDKTECFLKKAIKPGNWYQFKIAAVNENGTKGYSKTSYPFSTSVSPKPPKKPLDIAVSRLYKTKNGSINAELKWKEPPSDLPVQKYKLFWSIRLHGIKALDSVFVRHQFVSKEQKTFLLKNLSANSEYFLQLQAISQFGKQRLKSDKSNLLLNTTLYKKGVP
ncbi:anosmin-1 isoform X1 [Sitophilus oryzae]|uniref:Anosmin-1 isoform X1 n=1 Tax=Sitophilus oryzae TaxID=7048 RepID=A0A6J2YWB0_SITOR|nr:anosmin-1 isoform X1 [Sitophilus oryzae]XP_030767548.1 anosmin-1 isoform X1 [Sitophilus oryzae]XP_030767549.1 anosmin-1 isoform X1 [Sitophilus oryzae]XP_030767550.1 anosmin-1 isoform X1 [Sitophilus oryzae]XP_030767551.1 anosmin-1 isoform X1 [Sitophilus oryzae]XP_030767552.1 anosmin-1 isoform X1 [Sitophilus oryzae]